MNNFYPLARFVRATRFWAPPSVPGAYFEVRDFRIDKKEVCRNYKVLMKGRRDYRLCPAQQLIKQPEMVVVYNL